MPESRKNTVAWAALLLTLITYAVATASTIASQGQRITSLEQWREQERAERAQTIMRMETKQKEIMDKLESISVTLAEQRVLLRRAGRRGSE